MKGMVLGYRLRSGCFFLWALSLLGTDRAAVAQAGYQLRADRLVVENGRPLAGVDATDSRRGGDAHRNRSAPSLPQSLQPTGGSSHLPTSLEGLQAGAHPDGHSDLDSTVTRDIRGNVLTQKKSGQTVPVYTYLMRMGISRVGSNPADAAAILDGDRTTYWEPSASAPLDDWWVEVDLGRVAVVDSVVLHFVEASLGDPFRQFRCWWLQIRIR